MATGVNFVDAATKDAKDAALHFLDEIVENLINMGSTESRLHDYDGGDDYHHENHVDHDYKLTEASEIIDQLSDYEETDSGLWQGLEPRRAIVVQAAYTYGNAVLFLFREIIGDINDDGIVSDMLEDMEEESEDSSTGAALRERVKELINDF